MKTHNLKITYGTSKGAETFGYNLVSLRGMYNGKLYARTCGGGYDMRGTVFGEWLQNEYQAQLLELAKENRFPICAWNALKGAESNYTRPNYDRTAERAFLYGATYYANGASDKPAPHVTLDGGCGFESMRRIAEAIGLMIRTFSASKSIDLIEVTDNKTESN